MMEDEERQRKLQAGKAKLAEYRQRKAQSDGQKKQKKKKRKTDGAEEGEPPTGDNNTVFTLSKSLRSGETVTHDQTYTIEPESEVSTTAEDCSSEEEDLPASDDLQSAGGPQSRIQNMEDELAADEVQQLQDFEEALKQRDEIITQLTANLQQARAEKEEVMREFLELTEQSQKLQIQFQQLQAGEILRSSNISSTAADLLQARQQITLYQQQLEEKEAQVKGQQEQLTLILQLQERLSQADRVRTQAEETFAQTLREKDLLNLEQQRQIAEHAQTITQLQDQLLTSKQEVEEANKRLATKTQELDGCEKELSASRQKERLSSGEILQLMKTVEDLQQRCHSQSEAEALQRLEDEWSRRLEQLRAELDEMYGQQIVQMKQELRLQHDAHTDTIVQQHRAELEGVKGQLFQSAGGVNVLNVKLIELQQKLQETQVLRDKAEQELEQSRAETHHLTEQLERLRSELRSTAELQDAVRDLQTQLDAALEDAGRLESQHESEITNYKIKLDMLEREKDAVLDRMAESQEAELERLRTQLLFSHEEELSRLRDESQMNAENLRHEMAVRQRELESERAALQQEVERLTQSSDRETLLQKINHLTEENTQAYRQITDLREEIDRQKNTFSFAERNFEVNYLELQDEYTCVVNARALLEERLVQEEKHTTELMEKLEASESEQSFLSERLTELRRRWEAHEPQEEADERVLTQEGREGETRGGAPAQQQRLTHTHTEERLPQQQVNSGHDQTDGDAVRSSSVMQPQEMDGDEHEECRLQLEAQRISLLQIHAAQLELLSESLTAQLRSREQELQELREVNGQTAGPSDPSVQQLKSEFQESSARLEETHRREIERLKTYYQTQMEEVRERFTAEILLLQTRLQELTGDQEIFSVPRVLTTDESHECVQDAERLSVATGASLSCEPEASCGELTDLERRAGAPAEETDLRRWEEKHQQEQLEEEIAKVIVQMSVEFAQQTELARVSRQARETSTGIQTEEEEEEDEEEENAVTAGRSSEEKTREEDDDDDTLEEEQEDEAVEGYEIPPELPDDDDDDDDDDDEGEHTLAEDCRSALVQQEEEHTRELETLRSAHTRQLEIQQEQNTHLTTQIHTLQQRLLQREQELQQMMKDREDESESPTQSPEQTLPSRQSCGTQTEQRSEEEEDRGHGRSQSADQEPELTADVITNERDVLRRANARLRQVLMDVLKTTAAAEETIGRHVEGILEASSKSPLTSGRQKSPTPAGDVSSESFPGSAVGPDDASMFSAETDEGLEMSLKGAEFELHEAELLLEREEYLMSISTRLQSALEKLLIAITETTNQLEHARITQTELMREKFRHNEEMEELLRRQEELQERLCEEERSREQLALELHRAEGVIDGYTGERLALEQQVRERAELQLHLEQELRVTSSRLRELEQERQHFLEQRELLERQQDAMKDGAGSRELRLVEAALDAAPEADLLEETEKLMQEKVEVQRQAQKESGELQRQVKTLEAELEEQVSRVTELQEAQRTQEDDLLQQIQALEKQLENNRRFMDEQAADREHERDVFQQEIYNLEQQLKNPAKTQTGSERRDREVQELSRALQEKSDWCSELLLSSEQLQRDVSDRDEEIETLGARVRELEHTLMSRVEEVQHVSMASRADVTLEAQLQTEREALDRKEKEIVNLEEQLEQFREELENKSEEVNQLHMQLEIQRKEISSHQQDLQAQARLTQVVEEKDRQIAVLTQQIASRQRTGTQAEEEVLEQKDELLHDLEAQVECLRSEQQRLKRKHEEEAEQLNAVIEKLQQELAHIEHTPPHDDEEMRQKMEEERQEALREKTAALLVLQAQVQALEESAGARVTALSLRVEELEAAVEEKDEELRACRLKVERAQDDAHTLYSKAAQLEEKLQEKVAAVLVSQAQLEALQTQTKEPVVERRLTERLRELEEGLSGMQEDRVLQKQLLSSSEEEVLEYERRLGAMIDLLNQMRAKPSRHTPLTHALVSVEGSRSLSELLEELQEVKGDAASTKEELNCYRELSHKLQEDVEMKESMITQLQTALSQVSVDSREDDAAEVVRLLQELQEVRGQASSTQQELQEVRGQASSTQQELDVSREQSVRLQELLQEREMSIALLKDQLHRASQQGERSTEELLQELQEVRGQAAATKEELSSFRERSLKLQEEIQVRDVSIAELREKVQELQALLTKSADQQPPSEPKRKTGKNGDNREPHGMHQSADASEEQPSGPHANSSSVNRAPVLSQADAGTQTEPTQADEVQEVMEGYAEKIGQMQELHAAEIMDMEARHISESESLKRDNQQLEDECRALRDAIHKIHTAEGPSGRSECPAVSPFKDGYTSDSSSDWSQRVGQDQGLLQQEYRSTPEGAHRDAEPDVLPDRIKNLLREVHQEGMQVLSLSELPLNETPLPPQSWSNERDALLNTVQSLKSLISKLETGSQVEGDWRAELLSAVQQVFVHERDVLKSVLYSQLDRLDTADAVIHLNQLERALAEQDVRHREAMGVLSSADRNSLRSEIRQLRHQLHSLTTEHTQRPLQDTTEVTPAAGSSSDRLMEEMKTELSQTKLELESALKTQHKHLKELDTLRAEVSLRAAEVDSLTDRLADEQKRVRELQWAFEKEKCKTDRKEETGREEVEDLKLSLEEQRGRVAELSAALEDERLTSGRLREQVEGRQAQELSVASELQVQLEAQRARAVEMSRALEQEKELNTQLLQRFNNSSNTHTQDTLMEAQDTCSQVEAGVVSVESLLQTLQTQLAQKQEQVVQLMEELERHRLEEVHQQRQWDEERSALTHTVAQEQSALRNTQQRLTELERRAEQLGAELEEERENGRRLEAERERLQERVRQLEDRLRALNDAPPTDRTRHWVMEQTTGESPHDGMDNILSRLQLIATRINSLTSDTPDRLSAEESRESLAWLHSNVQDVMSLLQRIPSAPSAPAESAALLTGGSSSLLNERLLRQNAELTGFVSRLTEEKNDLRNQFLKLEEELRRTRGRKEAADGVWSRPSAGRQELLLFSSERESWAQERKRLQKSLRQAEAELTRLRAEVRSDTLRDLTSADVDNTALKRMYGKYLRAESFRKALIYQKKYLLLLLGGFQECEEATLSLIARMGGLPSHSCLENVSLQRRGFTRFRSAVRVSIALSRMRFLVKRWQRAVGGGVASQMVSRNGLAQITGAEVRVEAASLSPGGAEVFRRPSHRGRTGRESPRSAVSLQHRFQGVSVDALPCSHLQNYDPDRALTDYISRLEALQRRLGSVQSGSSPYAPLHFGVRR